MKTLDRWLNFMAEAAKIGRPITPHDQVKLIGEFFAGEIDAGGIGNADRRERIATAALQGFIASYAGDNLTTPLAFSAAENAVAYADALIAELDR